MTHIDTNFYTDKVKNFTEQLAVYEDAKPAEESDAEVRSAYEQAVQAVEKYTKILLVQELYEDSALNYSRVQLRLPDRILDIAVHAEGADDEVNAYELVETPIGFIDEYFYKQLLENKYNPISVMYKHLGMLVRGIHNMISIQSFDAEILCGAVLNSSEIQDVIGVYRMDTLLRRIDDFLNGEM